MSCSRVSILFFLTVFLVSCVTLTPEDRIVNAKRSIGVGTYSRAITHLEPLLGSGNNEAEYLLGVVAFKTKQNDHARDIFLPLAEDGYEPAYMQLAQTYRRLNQYKDFAAWLKKAAEARNSKAQFQLAQLYWYGRGVPKDRAAAFALVDAAYESPQTRKEAAGWKELYEFIMEMEEGPQEMIDGGCIVYINDPYLSAVKIDKTSRAWCDKRLDHTVADNAIEAVRSYLKENFPYSFDYQVKAEFIPKATGVRISGVFNKSRGSSKALLEYETGPGASSGFLQGLSADSASQPSGSVSTTNELVDLMVDPKFLFDPSFSRDRVSVDGIKLGDLAHAIPQERIKKQKTEGNWLHLNNGARFRLQDGIIVEIGIPKSRTKALQVVSEANVIKMFGKPDRIEQVKVGSIVLVRQYQYLQKGLLVNWSDRLGGLAHITVFSEGVCAGFNCP